MPGESVRLGMAVVPIRLWVSTNGIKNTGMAPAGTKKVCRHHRLGGSAPAHAGEEYASSYLLTVVGTADNWRRNGQDELETELVRDPVGFWRMAVLAWAPLPRPGSSLRPSTLAVRPSILLSIPSTRSPVLTVKVPTLSLNSRWSLTNSVGSARPTANGSWLPPSKTCPLQVPPRFRPAVPDFQRPPSSTAGFPSARGRGLREWEVGFPVMPAWPNSTTCCCTNEGYGTPLLKEHFPVA